ncbi:acyl-CoA dehydrogenase [Pseudomonas umsongensis]|jgi:alkylation response protein AidB-like acyl-CoA dehydrogenase|uniref:acyl-CoA dehydrogenase family protein n=1 Tax=Pseudomonas TaxID=286 RepID=UPI000343245C|nr:MULTISPECIES: acyl-CoA dehydrogenase family protein [Pseudomonas]EPA95180.1 acyl-CoA dehydrogenase [Pseudomonas sp. G5(2012)]QFG30219.1 acyl-CoA dehydrogenase [Pseudomonas umsongensis]
MSDTNAAFLGEQELMIRDSARKVAAEVVAPTAAERDRSAAWPRNELQAVAELGFLGMLIPEEYGGAGASFVEYCLAIEEFAAADTGFATLIHVHNSVGLAVARLGNEQQKRKYLPDLACGKRIGAFLLSEPHAGSDTAAFRTQARREGEHYVINGSKQFISNGNEAGLGLVLAVTDKAAGKKGSSLLMVDPQESPGYVVARVEHKMGQRSAHVAQIQLDQCRVPVANLLGEEGAGYRNVMGSLSEGRVAIAAVATGTARAALDSAVGYAKEREAYGEPIIKLQGVAFDLADMAAQVDVAHHYMVHAARLCEAHVPCAKEASVAKLFASEMAEKVCSDALQIHGGYGYLNDFPVERYCRDVRVTKIYEGTSHIQKLIIARSLA